MSTTATADCPRPRRGRPRKIRSQRRLRNVTVCLTEHDAAEIARRAAADGLSMSTWIRRAALAMPSSVPQIKNQI